VERKKPAFFTMYMVREAYWRKSPAGSNRLPLQEYSRSKMAVHHGSPV
jgi:hypothetical protein